MNSQEEAEGDHPLNTDQNSRWKEYFRVRPTARCATVLAKCFCARASAPNLSRMCGLHQDAEMLEQIERDVMRTHPDMHFFSGDDPIAVRHRKVCMSPHQLPA